MPNIIQITDLAAPELDIYARLTQRSCATGWSRKRGSLLRKAPRSSPGRWTPDCVPCLF